MITHDLDGKARGVISFVIRGVCVVIGRVEVRWDAHVAWVRREAE